MSTQDKEALRAALIAIRNEPRFAPFNALLQTMRDREVRALLGHEGNAVYRAQGAARAFEEIQNLIERSKTPSDQPTADGIKTAGTF